MASNPHFIFLKRFFGDKEDREEKEREMETEDKSSEKNIIQITKQKEKRLDLTKTFRSEFHFLKFPFFDLSPRYSKKDRIEIREIEETEEGRIEVLWKVERSIDSNFPSSFARRLHKEVVEKILNNAKRPIPQLVRLGSFREICRKMGLAESGKNFEDIKKALKDIKKASIEAKGTFRQKEKNGKKKFFEGNFNLYDMIYFSGETLPDGTEAEEVYIFLNSMYIQNFNNNFVVPMDYQYYQVLQGDIASRMYEVLSVWFYPALENGKKHIEKEYSELCNYFPLTRQTDKWKAKGQLKKAHQQHVLNGFIASEPEWIDTNKKDDWLIRYYIGQRAKEWYYQNKKLGNIGEEVKQIEQPKEAQNQPKEEKEIKTETPKLVEMPAETQKPAEKGDQSEKSQLVIKMANLGITRQVAENLVKSSHSKVIEDWIEAIQEIKAKDKAAFLVKAIKENWELPEIFRKKREEKIREQELIEQQKEKLEIHRQYMKYLDYKKEKVSLYLEKIPHEEKKQEMEKIKRELIQKHPIARTWHGQILESTIEAYFIENVKEIVYSETMTFQEWQEEENRKKKEEQLFEVDKIEEIKSLQPHCQE